MPGEFDGFPGRIGTGSGDYRYPASRKLDDLAHYFGVLLMIQGRRFPRGTHGDDGIGTMLDMKGHQPGQCLLIEFPIRVHRGD